MTVAAVAPSNTASLRPAEPLVRAAHADDPALADFQAHAADLATRDPRAFGAILDQAFGPKLTPQTRAELTAQAQAGALPMPTEVRFVDEATLGGALGAYSPTNGGTVYLNEALRDDPAALQAVLAQEIGHHFDAVLGGPDAAGDEGRVFAAALKRGGALPEAERALAASAPDRGVITVGGRKVEVEFALPAIAIWLAQGAAQTVPDAVIGTVLAQLTGIPYTWVDRLVDFGLNLIPGAGQADTARKLGKIGEAIDSIIDAARLGERLPRSVVHSADGLANDIRRTWGQFQDQALSGDWARAGSTWGALIGKIRELQVAGRIADRGGTLENVNKVFDVGNGTREFDVIFREGGSRIFGEVKTGRATMLRRGSDQFDRTLANFIAQRDFAAAQGAAYRLYADDFSPDMANALRAAGIDFVQSATILR